jgi:pyruvate dehydrogenase E2 component (dihydrolipoamide acetyltransferase)
METLIEFKLPALGENIEQGDLVRLMIAPGAKVSEGESVMELETDKAVVEVPSSVSGTVKEILVKEGDKIKVGSEDGSIGERFGRAGSSACPGRGRGVVTASCYHAKHSSTGAI